METLKVNGGKSIRGIYYFKSKDGAAQWANANGWITPEGKEDNPVRFVSYGCGIAIQAGKSGNYAGTNYLDMNFWY